VNEVHQPHFVDRALEPLAPLACRAPAACAA
jgi:hypothetical protein